MKTTIQIILFALIPALAVFVSIFETTASCETLKTWLPYGSTPNRCIGE